MSYKDVREWIQKVQEMGELKVVEGADWNLEIGALSVLASKHKENSPALLFDRIKDYPAGYRILVGFFESLKRSALTTNLPLDITPRRIHPGLARALGEAGVDSAGDRFERAGLGKCFHRRRYRSFQISRAVLA